MAANGSRDFRVVLNPCIEKMFFIFAAELMRSGLISSASGAKTKPPCRYPTTSEATSADDKIGTTQRSVSTLVQKRSGPLASTGLLAASSEFLKKSAQ